MTPRELAAFNAGIAHAASLAQIAAITIEIRDDARHLRQQAAVAALQGLAEGLRQAANPAHAAGTSNAEISGVQVPSGPASASQIGAHESNTRLLPTGVTGGWLPALFVNHGFTGDTCDACGSAEMKRSGTCLTCQACGSTTGCG